MITARNYAAQAEQWLRIKSQATNEDTFFTEDERKTMQIQADSIAKSIHFTLPDGGWLLYGRGGSIIGQKLNLPYKAITIEFFRPLAHTPEKFLILASQDDSGTISITAMTHRNKNWTPFYMLIDGIGEIASEGEISTGDHYIMYPTIKRYLEQEYQDIDQQINRDVSRAVWHTIELVEALSCRNITTQPIEKIDPKVNARRIKDGKLPLYETKMLVVDTKATFNEKGEYQGGSHASPRQHLRRGHIRRLPKGNIWVNSCVVGDPNKGTINKQYAVK